MSQHSILKFYLFVQIGIVGFAHAHAQGDGAKFRPKQERLSAKERLEKARRRERVQSKTNVAVSWTQARNKWESRAIDAANSGKGERLSNNPGGWEVGRIHVENSHWIEYRFLRHSQTGSVRSGRFFDGRYLGRQRSTPHGFPNRAKFESFNKKMTSELKRGGYPSARVLFQGSSVTGRSFRTGKPFDAGRISDFDLAICSPKLMKRMRDLGYETRTGGIRSAKLTQKQLDTLRLSETARVLRELVGRPVEFMIYESVDLAQAHKPSIEAKPANQ